MIFGTAGDFLPSFIVGIGWEDTAASYIYSRNFLKSLSAIFLPEDFYSSLKNSFVYFDFSGVALIVYLDFSGVALIDGGYFSTT